MLHLRRLSYFLAVLDHGTLMAAAEALHVAQPALSRQIRTLESELGLHLFDRERGRLRPTPTAIRFEGIARALLEQASLAERATRSLRTGSLERLVCVTTRATADGLLAPFIETLSAEDPLIACREVEHGEVERALLEGADLAISPLPPSGEVDSIRLGTVSVLATVNREHPWAVERRHSVAVTDLVKEFLIIPPQTSISRQELDQALRRNGLSLGAHLVEEIGATTLALAKAGRGVAVITASDVGELWPVPVTNVDGVPLSLSIYACWRREHYAAGELRALSMRMVAFMREQIVLGYANTA